jgi:hypothetical protein
MIGPSANAGRLARPNKKPTSTKTSSNRGIKKHIENLYALIVTNFRGESDKKIVAVYTKF